MRLLLRLQYIHFPARPLKWWADSTLLSVVTGEVEAAGLGDGLRFMGMTGETPEELDRLSELPERALAWEEGSYRVASDRAAKPERYMDLDLVPGQLALRLSFAQKAVDAAGSELLDRLVRLVCGLGDRLEGHALMGPWLHVEALGASYPRPRPPRTHSHFRPGTVVTFLCRTFHREHEGGASEDAEKVLTAPLPPTATRIDHGPLVVLRWVSDITDPESVRAGRTAQDRWLSEVLKPPVESGYNALGDHRVTPVSLEDHPPLTKYDGFGGQGYKAIVDSPGSPVGEDLWAQLSGWAAEGALPDGTRLEALNLITPNRDTALRVRDRATQAGIRGVYYMDDSGALWNPFPAGEWLKTNES